MERNDFAEYNKASFSKEYSWEMFLNELRYTREFIDNLCYLVFGRDMNVIYTNIGLSPVYSNHILQSAAQTLQSAIVCAEYGNLADVHLLIRKYRDDLFFYLYIIIACNSNDFFTDEKTNKKQQNIKLWNQNELSNLNISTVLKEISRFDKCTLFIEKYKLKDSFTRMGKKLNDYTHGNGRSYYNRLHSNYYADEIDVLANDLKYMLNYISISFVFILLLLHPEYIVATDYFDAFNTSTVPDKKSKYWVAPFVREFIERYKSILDESALDYLRETKELDL